MGKREERVSASGERSAELKDREVLLREEVVAGGIPGADDRLALAGA